MYPVSQAYKLAMNSKARREYVRGTITKALARTYEFTSANVISMSYSNRCSDTSDITLGSVYVGQLTATFYNVKDVIYDEPIPFGDWRGMEIDVEVGLMVDEEEETIEWVPLGIFTVSSAEWTDKGVNIVAFDNVIKLDKPVGNLSTLGGTVWNIASYCCTRCGLQLENTTSEIESWTNGSDFFEYEFNPENDCETYRDVLSYLAALVGAFVTADRGGEIKLVRLLEDWHQEYYTIPKDGRILGTVISDYNTYYLGVTYVRTGVTYYKTARIIPDTDARRDIPEYYINLGKNPFLDIKYPINPLVRMLAIENLANMVNNRLVFVPFKLAVLSTVAYDLGDFIKPVGWDGYPNLRCSCVMQIEWTLNQTTAFQGFGADPKLKTGTTSTDKAVSSASSSSALNEITYCSFESMEEIVLEDGNEVDVTSIMFTAKDVTDVEMWQEYLLHGVERDDPDIPIKAVLTYYMDGSELDYSPIEEWANDDETMHILGTNYYWNGVSKLEQHTWRVTLRLLNGSAVIGPGNARAVLKGQKLVNGESTDNLIQASDLLGYFDIKTMSVIGFSESVSFDLLTHKQPTGTDDVNRPDFEDVSVLGLEDSVTVKMRLVNDWVWMSGQAFSGDTFDDTLF